MPDVTQKLLTQQLQGLEAADLIDREVLVQIPSKVGRSISDLGSRISDLGFRTYTRAHDGLHHWLGHL